jgi:hypothetical protein
VAGFYGNLGNYHNFGAKKFAPAISPEKFLAILQSHPLADVKSSLYHEILNDIWPQVEPEVFRLDAPFTDLNYPHKGGVTAYFSRNMTTEDLALVGQFMKSQNMLPENTRAFKMADKHYAVTVGSADVS